MHIECFFVLVSSVVVVLSINNPKYMRTYKAAVIEYSPKVSALNPQDLLLQNVNHYSQFIDEASEQGVQIIVFPEDGLTGLNVWINATLESLSKYSSFVPEPSDNVSPCDDIQEKKFSKALIDLSCAARTSKIYVVVNLFEKSISSIDNSTVLYNTNVVFDRNGKVIAKYRKINLFFEPLLTPGNGTTTFTTDFGVTFTIFTCFDILFKNPSLDSLTDDVKDVIYPVAWFSEVPFLQALSVQAGYSKANGVNLLASGLSNATNGNGGSGIYFADGTIKEVTFSAFTETSNSKMIIQDVPIWSAKQSSCDQIGSYAAGDFKKPNFSQAIGVVAPTPLIVEDLSNYTTKNLNVTSNSSSTTLCSEGSSFCCTFEIEIDMDTIIRSNLKYKLAVFNGNRVLGESTSGNQICGVVACLSDDIKSCGKRMTASSMIGIRFNSINISGNFVESPAGNSLPTTLTFSLTPIEGYSYCRRNLREKRAQVTMNLTVPHDSIFAFGIFGRMFQSDGRSVGRSMATFNTICMVSVFFLTVLTVLQQKIIS